MTEKQQQSQGLLPFLTNFFSGGLAGVIAKTVSAPIERVKLLLQTQKSNERVAKHYHGIGDCITRTYKEEGVLAFWRGNGVNVIRYFPTQALNFSFKDYYGQIFLKSDKNKEPFKFFLQNLLAGGLAGCTTTIFVHPLDFARTRLGVDVGRGKDRQFKGLFDCMSKIMKSDGPTGLYRGFFASVIGIFVYRSLYFGMYDTGKALFLSDKEHSFLTKFLFAQAVVISAESVSYPTDTIKRRLMMQSGKQEKLYTGFLDCLQKMARNEGVKAFWTGNLSNVYRGFGSSLTLVLYDVFQEAANGKKKHH